MLISPKGEILARYRKVHLFSVEKEMFEPGNEAAVIETEMGTLGLTICMDLLFPEYIRGLVLSGAAAWREIATYLEERKTHLDL